MNGLPDDAATVETLAVQDIDVQGRRVIDLAEMMCVYGDTGVGKTHAVERLLQSVDMPWFRLELASDVSRYEFFCLLGEAVLGATPHGFTAAISAEITEALTAQPVVVWLDEAQFAPVPALQRLRVMHARPGVRWALVLSGYRLDRRLARAADLSGRMGAWVEVRPLTGTGLLDALAAYHPAYAATPAAVLVEHDRLWAAGRWRSWARTLQVGLPLLRAEGLERFDELTLALVRSASAPPRTKGRGRNAPMAPVGAGLQSAAQEFLR